MDAVWLNSAEQAMWREWTRLNAELTAALQGDLQAESGLSIADYQVLAELTESRLGRCRVSGLVESLQWEQSRVSHHVRRMEKRGLVVRSVCDEDGRGSYVAVSEQGRAAIELAAPGHVRAVRRLLLDALSVEEVDELAMLLARIRGRLAAGVPAASEGMAALSEREAP